MKIADINGCAIHAFPTFGTMVIVEPDAIFFRCLICGETKSVHMLTDDNRSLPWMRQCYCGSNAPDNGGDKPPEEPEPAMPLDEEPAFGKTLTPAEAYNFIRNATQQYQARLVHRRDDR